MQISHFCVTKCLRFFPTLQKLCLQFFLQLLDFLNLQLEFYTFVSVFCTFVTHIIQFVKIVTMVVQCTECSSQLSDRRALNKHLQRKHSIYPKVPTLVAANAHKRKKVYRPCVNILF